MKHTAVTKLLADLAAMQADDRSENLYRPDEAVGRARAANLQRYLADMAEKEPRILMVMEAPGYRGCAKTGIPITSERIMMAGVDEFGLFGEGYQSTSDHPRGVAEASATIMWGALRAHTAQPPLLWNTCPLHPHKPGNTESNRTPTRSEQRRGHPFITRVVDLFDITRVFGVGRVAQRNLTELNISHIALRHPAQGGKAEFIEGLTAALKE